MRTFRLTALMNHEERKLWPDSFKQAEDLTSPRVLKTHVSYEMLPKDIMDKKEAKVKYEHK